MSDLRAFLAGVYSAAVAFAVYLWLKLKDRL